MSELINPIEVLGPVQCRHCGADMGIVVASADGITLDHDGNPSGLSSLIEESYMLCRHCGATSDYTIDSKTLSYKVRDIIDSFGDRSDEEIEEFDMICSEMNPFHIRDEMRYNNSKGE